MRATITFFGLDTENGWVDAHTVELEVTSMRDAEDGDEYYDIAMEYTAQDLGCDVYSYEYYEWNTVEEDE